MKNKLILKMVILSLIFAFVLPLSMIFSACDLNPTAQVEVVFVIDGRKYKTAEIDKFGDLTKEEANELFGETRDGYTFDGWYTDAEMTHSFEGIAEVLDKVVLYGTFVEI